MTEHTDRNTDNHLGHMYQAASDAAAGNERASIAVRQAILAAAARAVQAQPVSSNTSFQQGRSRNWLRLRQPLALAATLVIGVGVGLHLFEQQQAGVEVNREGNREDWVASVPPVAAPATSVNAPTPATPLVPSVNTEAKVPATASAKASALASDVLSPQMQPPRASRAPKENEVTMRRETPAPEQSVMMAEATRAAPAEMAASSSAPASVAPAPVAPAPVAPAPVAPAPVAPAAGMSRSQSADLRANQKLAGAAREHQSADAAMSVPAAQADMARNSLRPAAEWLAAIIELRKSGKGDEAERQLSAFRRAYPQMDVPREALP